MNSILSIDEYFEGYGKYADILKKFEFKEQSCELCGSHDFTRIREYSDAGSKVYVKMPINACNKCGYVQQALRSEEEFYHLFYNKIYVEQQRRSEKNKEVKLIEGEKKILDGVENAKVRARNLYNYLCTYYPKFKLKDKSYRLLDVGCGVGGFLDFFRQLGWEVEGNDPDPTACKAAKEFLNLDIDCIEGEKMKPKGTFDIIVIIGSLEHCQDPKRILKLCHEALDKDGVIIIEGRYFPISHSTAYLNFNHHRFLRSKQLQLMLWSCGYIPTISTTYPVCGEDVGRKGEGWCFAMKSSTYPDLGVIELGRQLELYEEPMKLKISLDKHDQGILVDKK